jgi:hypothetical protein
MKTNKFSKYIAGALFLFGAVTVVSSCKKFLEVAPVSSFGTDYVFSNVANADKSVIGVYATLGGDQGYGIRLSLYYPLDNDEMMGQGATPYPDNERRSIAHYGLQSSNTQLAGPFNQLYAGVERANICIYNIPKMDAYTNGSASDKKQLQRLYGESLTLRAQMYFELVRNWGDLPAQWQPSSFETDLFKPKTDRDTIYDHILADLATAETLLPWRTEASGITNERITQGAARALRARIALFRGGYSLRTDKQMKRPADYKRFYQIAYDECAAIMARTGDHNLNSSYQAVFKDAIDQHKQEPNGEVLWEVGMAGGGSNFGDSKLGYYNGPRVNGTGNGALTVLPTYFYAFDPNDTRRDVMCAPYDVTATTGATTRTARTLQTMVDGKFRRDWTATVISNAQYFGTNWPVIRYSDVLLMFAEADNELNSGPTAAGKAAYEKVRLRGFGGNASLIGTTPSAYGAFFTAIVNERMFELGGEGIRKYDLIRWNMLGTKLAETKAKLTAMYQLQAPYNNLPTTMYYKTNSATLEFANSFYAPAPATAPAGYTAVSWVGTGINTTILTYFAIDFTPNKNELLPLHTSTLDANPKLKQDYGY